MDQPKEKYNPIADYILSEETAFRTRRTPIGSNWDWNMYEHIDKSFHLKNSQFTKGDNNNFLRPFKNIILPIANVNYRSEGFDVKDIELYVNNADKYHLSLLTRRYHDKWAIDNDIDTAIDETVESYFDYGLALVKYVNDSRPVVIDLKSDLAFCDQSDVLSGAICLKHNYSIDELQDMKGKWDSEKIDDAIVMSSFTTLSPDGRESRSPSKSVEVYELHGVFPNSWLNEDTEYGDETDDSVKTKKASKSSKFRLDPNGYSRQMHIVTYYTDSEDNKNGICLFKGPVEQLFKALKRDPIAKRACGRGGIEELFHPQTWANYSEIHLQGMLEATSKVITKTTDKKLAQQNNISNIKNNQILYVEEGKTWEQMVIQPFNKVAFDNYTNSWEQTARTIGSASDPQLGLNPVSGTPLGTTEIVTNQGQGIHEYRRGKVATFWGEIYRDYILKHVATDLSKGQKWMAELSTNELQDVAEKIAINESNKKIDELVISSGQRVSPEQVDLIKQSIKETFRKGGKSRFLSIVKDELSEIPLDVKFNIASKQKDLYNVVNKLNAVFRTVFANPAVLQNQGMGELFNNILESSGLSPIDFTSLQTPQPQQAMQPQGMQQSQPSPMGLPTLTNNIQ